MIRARHAGLAIAAAAFAGSACGGEDDLVFELEEVRQSFEEVVPCRWSHEHELNHVRIFADPTAAEVFRACVLSGEPDECEVAGAPVAGFPPGSLFVKYEYDTAGCAEGDLVGYTASLRLEDGSLAEGRDWRWQRVSANMELIDDGAPPRCVDCHIDHCDPPEGFDLRCLPD